MQLTAQQRVARQREHLAGLQKRLDDYAATFLAGDPDSPEAAAAGRRAAVRVVEYLRASDLVGLLRDTLASPPKDTGSG